MKTSDLINKIKYLEKIGTNYNDLLTQTHYYLERNFINKELILKLNDTICEIHEEGIDFVTLINKIFQNYWDR